jgi:hypothetical protein
VELEISNTITLKETQVFESSLLHIPKKLKKKNQNTFSKVPHINHAMFDKKERLSERNEGKDGD